MQDPCRKAVLQSSGSSTEQQQQQQQQQQQRVQAHRTVCSDSDARSNNSSSRSKGRRWWGCSVQGAACRVQGTLSGVVVPEVVYCTYCFLYWAAW
eukprot:CAMPEP_0202893286 /NCGR_PEP_ID=MMETSP1392-20130828/2891_1 /ASSEMBLY_ACC=CAM_ASM_000868 /TAXON_ID=225041 /ORGANISM="Chlamydomonas chlamydogama, Strain SAG 11-48b" /LENGTH=94 /DNA_ID=CAMNT_0049577567 /DNA_START=44 /DNA_END=325 /DNA_ORIENTATION=-